MAGVRQLALRRVSGPCSTTRASSASSRSGEASSGLMSISLIHGCSTTSWLKRTRDLFQSAEIDRLAAANALESRDRSCVCSIMRRASVVLSGGSASARSLNTSTSWPPVPNSSTGPNCASRLLPMISS